MWAHYVGQQQCGCVRLVYLYHDPSPFLPFLSLSPHAQLKYRETLQEGAAVRVPFADTEGSAIALQASPIVEAAVKVLRPNQQNQNVEPFYRQQAWHAIQVGVVSAVGGHAMCSLVSVEILVKLKDYLTRWKQV